MEYLFFSPNSLELIFPQGTLPSQEFSFWVSVSFSDECKALLYPWAIPHHNTQ